MLSAWGEGTCTICNRSRECESETAGAGSLISALIMRFSDLMTITLECLLELVSKEHERSMRVRKVQGGSRTPCGRAVLCADLCPLRKGDTPLQRRVGAFRKR